MQTQLGDAGMPTDKTTSCECCSAKVAMKDAVHSGAPMDAKSVRVIAVNRGSDYGRFIVILGLISFLAVIANAQAPLSSAGDDDIAKLAAPYVMSGSDSPSLANLAGSATPVKSKSLVAATPPQPDTGVDWVHLMRESASFLAVEHSFRFATEDATRYWILNFSASGYADSVASLHGWGDGDPFLVNYVGHPMQGAVSSFLWQHNDRAFRTAQFGRNRQYWKARLRGMAFAYAYSVQFEIGPISEASLGNVQSRWPQFGFVDHIVTPTIGMGWAVTEDALDRMLIRRMETHVTNPWVRMFVRGGLNPARSMANAMSGNVPWHRDDRPGVFKPALDAEAVAAGWQRGYSTERVDPPRGVAPFDFSFNVTARQYLRNIDAGTCVGGGATAGFRLSREWQTMIDVGGCRLLEWQAHWSGDSLTFVSGPRWTPDISSRWKPHLEVLFGGLKVTQEYRDPVKEAEAADMPDSNEQQDIAKHNYYTTDWDRTGFAIHAGGGLNVRLTSALELRLANLEYEHNWVAPLNGIQYRNSVQFSGGLVLNMGTW
jgi:hypothetical protein